MRIKRKEGKIAASAASTATAAGAIIAAVCIIIYLIALVQAIVRFYLSVDNYRITAEHEFSKIADTALFAGMQSFMDQKFIDTMNHALSSSKTIEALIITGPEGEYAFEKQKGRAVTWVNNTPRFINRVSLSNQSHYRPLPINDIRNANIKAVAGAYDYYEFQGILKETLFLILIGFTGAFFTMLFVTIRKPADIPPVIYVSNQERPKPAPVEPIREPAPEPASQPVYAPRIEPINESLNNTPKGLYSPRSNIGWEEYLIDRLNSELHRCASTEKDLTLIIMEFPDIKNDTMFAQAADEAVSFFSSRDLLFEYGKHGIAAILPNDVLEAGIVKSERFHNRIMEKFPHGYNSRSSLCIGLSSRAGRLLNAERLILETNEALKKAKTDPKSSIIAFKSDPEKYRNYIRKQG
ncbi:MAG: hypothetical protein LBU66_09030 [Treponema sp.]|jgi:GGDEF domain-containing protein|nr:hypothetical protein [Treponema sp.]